MPTALFESSAGAERVAKRTLSTTDQRPSEKSRARASQASSAASAAAAAQITSSGAKVAALAEKLSRRGTAPATKAVKPAEVPAEPTDLVGEEMEEEEKEPEEVAAELEQPEAEAEAAVAKVGQAGADVAALPASRKDLMDALPGLGGDEDEDVDQYHTLHLVPMRSTEAGEFAWDEVTSVAKVQERVAGLARYIDAILRSRPGDNLTLAKVSPNGNVDLQALRAAAEKNKSRGIAALRVATFFGKHVEKMLEAGGIMIAPQDLDELSCETSVATGLYPGSVMEQIYIQNEGLRSAFKYDNDAKMNCYQFEPTVEQRRAIARRGYLVKLGSEGTFDMRAISGQVSTETFLVYGTTGLGSAKLLAQPALSKRLRLSQDLVRVSGFNGARRGAGFIALITVPFSKKNLEAMHRMFQVGSFSLGNPDVPGYLMEITVAPTPVELEKILAFRLLNAPIDEAEDEIVEKAKDLSIRIVEGKLLRSPAEGLTLTPIALAHGRAHAGPHGEGERAAMHSCALVNLVTRNCALTNPIGEAAAEKSRAFSLWQSTAQATSFTTTWRRRRRHASTPATATSPEGGREGQYVPLGDSADRTHDGRTGEGRRRGGTESVVVEGHWGWRPMNHLLGWGFDARGRGGGRCK